ncbi:hypothetical protein [Sphingomonas aquatilis]
MVEREQALNMALSLTRRALELLDDFDERGPAVHLQQAIDVMTNAPIARTEEEVEAVLDSPECRAITERLGWNDSGAGAGG